MRKLETHGLWGQTIRQKNTTYLTDSVYGLASRIIGSGELSRKFSDNLVVFGSKGLGSKRLVFQCFQ